ncbi:MAG: type I secretion system permease/ATPase [Nitrincola lacisaponensis]|uniref:ABC transporter, transmembrane region:ABC transporter:Peptidase C39, bacteriocin processing n=1 Tax=Nitrincola lacisaponensis TaxID=267850 RepID=A0A063XYI3_9GAMM|nr:type I secretion system permease/ATPase [Nitrincola lacisaponensis]KDE39218.1 ABC transporter, transmembrane region:ABC transporter:Peptidase C39, bacteriocin processing [Nitrincola lacisaponensis]
MSVFSETPGGALLGCLLIISRFHDSPVSAETAIAGLPLVNGTLTPSVFHRAAKRAGLASRISQSPLEQLNENLLPAILILKDDKACVLNRIDHEQQTAEVIYPELSETVVALPLSEIQSKYTGQVIYARPEFRFDSRAPEIKKVRDRHWFWGVIAENRRLYRDVLLAAVMINCFAVAMPLFVMNVYDRVVPNHATDTLWVLAAGVFIVLSADLILRLMRSWFVDLGASRADVKLSSAIMERVLGMKMINRPASAGSFAANIQSFESVRSFIGSLTVVALVDLPFVLLFATVIAIIGWPLVLPIIAGALLVLIYALSAQAKMHSLSETSMRAGAMRNSTLIESLSNLETLKSFGAESRIQTIWEKTTIFLTRTAAQMRLISASITNGAQWTQHTVAVAIIIIGVYMIIEGNLTQGGLIAAYLLSSRAMAPISQAAGLLAQYHHSATAMQSLNEIMERPVERPENKNWISRPALRGEIEFKRVNFRYPDDERLAITDMSFKIRAGEHVAILGRNGSGKTTLEKLILGLYEPESGAILMDGVDLRQIDPSELRRQIGYVPQDVSMFFGTLKDNIITACPRAEDQQILRAATLSGLAPFINSHPAGFDMQVGERGQLLSGGQRQSVAIARALVNDPPILLMDEPTGSLDHTSEETFKQNLSRYSRGKTLLVVTHRSSLLTLADRIIVVDAGKIVADGPKAEVMEALKQGRVGSAN